MKKIIAIGAAVVLSLSLSGSAMAFWFLMPPMPPKPEPVEVEIENEDMLVVTKTMAKTVTGENSQWGIAKYSWSSDLFQEMGTGAGASQAISEVMVGMTGWSSVTTD